MELKNRYFPVLDYGFVALKDYMGCDDDIAEAARCSYGKGTKSLKDNEKLIRHLMRHKHTSPFEMAELKFHMGLPIFCARQIIRHRTVSVNEYSGRFSEMPTIYYTPNIDRCNKQCNINKQGSSEEQIFNKEEYDDVFLGTKEEIRDTLTTHYYSNLALGMARETARIDLPLSMYTYWYWKIDLHNLLHFLQLRLAPDAQWETRQYAKIMAGIVSSLFPITWKAFEDYRLNSINLSTQEQNWLIDHLMGVELSGGNTTELKEFEGKLVRMGKTDLPNYTLDLSASKDFSFFESQVSNEKKD